MDHDRGFHERRRWNPGGIRVIRLVLFFFLVGGLHEMDGTTRMGGVVADQPPPQDDVAAMAACVPDLNDARGPMRQLMVDWSMGSDSIFKGMNATLDFAQNHLPMSMVQCLANFHAGRMAPHVLDVVMHCTDDVNAVWPVVEPTMNELIQNWPSSGKINDYLAYIRTALDNALFHGVCPSAHSIMNTCLLRALPMLIFHLERESSGCCTSFIETAERNLGTDLSSFMVNFVEKVLNVFCSTRAPGVAEMDGSMAPLDYCGRSLITLFAPSSMFNSAKTLLPLLQVPNSQGCLAFQGKRFMTIKKKKSRLSGARYGRTFGVCAYAFDDLMSYVADLQIFQSPSFPLSGLFKEGQSLKGKVVVEWLSKVMDLNNLFKIILKQFSFHIPNHFVDQCSFHEEYTELEWNPFRLPTSKYDPMRIYPGEPS